MNMNFKNVIAVVVISAATAVMSVWGFGTYAQYQSAGVQESGKLQQVPPRRLFILKQEQRQGR